MWRADGGRAGLAPRAAFTLVELLVVVGIVAVLLSILVPTVSRVRDAAQSVATSAHLRELTALYLQYAQAHRGALLPGFLPTEVAGVAPVVTDPATGFVFTGRTARMWPWRLAEWSGGSGGGLMKLLRPTLGPADFPAAGDTPAAAESKAYSAALYPQFGLNTVFLGGHARSTATSTDFFRGFRADGSPNTGQHVAFRLNEVRRTDRQIVFTEVAIQRGSRVVDLDGLSGFHYVNPPRADRASGVYWHADDGSIRVALPPTPNRTLGIPYTRSNVAGATRGRIPAAFLDGHVDALRPKELTDMRLWAPAATSTDYDF